MPRYHHIAVAILAQAILALAVVSHEGVFQGCDLLLVVEPFAPIIFHCCGVREASCLQRPVFIDRRPRRLGSAAGNILPFAEGVG